MALAGLGLRMDRNVGGLSHFLIAPFADVKVTGDASTTLATVTLKDGTTITDSNNPYKKYLPLKESSNVTENITSAISAGTLYFEQIATMVFGNLEETVASEVMQLAKTELSIIAVDCFGKAIILGAHCGCDINPGTSATGTASGDLMGYTLAFRAVEPNTMYFVKDDVVLMKA